MSTVNPHEFNWELDLGWALTDQKFGGFEVVHKFGYADVGTSFVPVTRGGVYNTPQVGSVTTLRVKAGGDANDTAAGSGAREVTLEGIDATGVRISEAVATAGASASSATSASFLRLFRAYVSASGTYATASSGSHSADIVIENGAGGTDWATIASTGFSRSQTEIGVYTVPLGYTGFINKYHITVDSAKTADILLFQRRDILQTSAPYSAMRLVSELVGVKEQTTFQDRTPLGPFPALTDIGFMGKVASGNAGVSAEFEIILIPDSMRRAVVSK